MATAKSGSSIEVKEKQLIADILQSSQNPQNESTIIQMDAIAQIDKIEKEMDRQTEKERYHIFWLVIPAEYIVANPDRTWAFKEKNHGLIQFGELRKYVGMISFNKGEPELPLIIKSDNPSHLKMIELLLETINQEKQSPEKVMIALTYPDNPAAAEKVPDTTLVTYMGKSREYIPMEELQAWARQIAGFAEKKEEEEVKKEEEEEEKFINTEKDNLTEAIKSVPVALDDNQTTKWLTKEELNKFKKLQKKLQDNLLFHEKVPRIELNNEAKQILEQARVINNNLRIVIEIHESTKGTKGKIPVMRPDKQFTPEEQESKISELKKKKLTTFSKEVSAVLELWETHIGNLENAIESLGPKPIGWRILEVFGKEPFTKQQFISMCMQRPFTTLMKKEKTPLTEKQADALLKKAIEIEQSVIPYRDGRFVLKIDPKIKKQVKQNKK